MRKRDRHPRWWPFGKEKRDSDPVLAELKRRLSSPAPPYRWTPDLRDGRPIKGPHR